MDRPALRADIKVFQLVYLQSGLLKYFYQPKFKALIIFRLAQLCFRSMITRPLSYLLVTLDDLLCGVWIGPRVEAGVPTKMVKEIMPEDNWINYRRRLYSDVKIDL